MDATDPRKYDSVTDYLLALGFTISGDEFVKGFIRIPIMEIIKHTPVTFCAKAKAKGWITDIQMPFASIPYTPGLLFGDE